jgi:hypothetical protein
VTQGFVNAGHYLDGVGIGLQNGAKSFEGGISASGRVENSLNVKGSVHGVNAIVFADDLFGAGFSFVLADHEHLHLLAFDEDAIAR